MDLSVVYTSSSSSSSSSRSPSPVPRGRYSAEINAQLKCVAELSPHQCLVEEESVPVELEEEATTSRRQMVREEEIARIGPEVVSHRSDDKSEEESALFELVEELSSEEKISTVPERALSFLTKGCVFATTAMVVVCAMEALALANGHALTDATLSVLISAVILVIFCCVLSEWTKN